MEFGIRPWEVELLTWAELDEFTKAMRSADKRARQAERRGRR